MESERVQTRIPAEFRCGCLSGRGEVRNLSEGGLFVGTLAIPEEGSAVELTLSAPGIRGEKFWHRWTGKLMAGWLP